MIGAYQTRVTVFRGMDRGDGEAVLSAYGELYGRVERKLFAAVAAGRSATSLKSAYLREYRIPARMFNGVRVSLEGKVASVREAQKLHQDTLQRRIARAERQISDAVEQGRGAAGPSEAAPVGQFARPAGGPGIGHEWREGAIVLRVETVVAQAASPGGQRLCQS